MKKALITIGVIFAALVLVAGGYALRYFTADKCEGGTVTQGDPGPLSPTEYTENHPAPKLCGDRIFIDSKMRDNILTVTGWDECKRNHRDFPLSAVCPVTYRPYSLMLQAHALAGYIKQLGEFNFLVGGTGGFLWNSRHGSGGIGITYLQGLIVPEYYVGVTATGLLDAGARR